MLIVRRQLSLLQSEVYHTTLHYTALYCNSLHLITLQETIFSAQHYTAPNFTVLHCIDVFLIVFVGEVPAAAGGISNTQLIGGEGLHVTVL